MLFAVIRTRGAGWHDGRPLEDQPDWTAHASFMNGLARDGSVILGGPLEGTPDVLLVIEAATADAVHTLLAGDPWSSNDLLRITRVVPWTLRLGRLDA